MNEIENKIEIQEAIQNFASKPVLDAAIHFFNALGYKSDRSIAVNSVEAFCQQFDPNDNLNHPNALKDHWKSIHLLFQITDAELSNQLSLFQDNSVKASLLQSYIFFAIELSGKDYARGKLAAITRQLNQIFPMPVMILFKITNKLSIAVINRRQSKRDESKDVLGKVTLIHNIAVDKPHPGHLDILASFSTYELFARKTPIGNFDELHTAWEEVFNVELLNERFYQELSNWYFWARHHVKFPADLEPDEEKRNSTSVIRLLTRMIFCWFLKEKGLIDEQLFDKEHISQYLVSFGDDESTYYRAILQNLFFATLNQHMNAKGKIMRQFAENKTFVENRNQYGIKNLYRYKDLFRDPAKALALFEDIPFLHGGLFTCLDPEDDDGKVRYADGFSRNPKKQPTVPNFLFFSDRKIVDLSSDYGETKKKSETVRGLLLILRNYKFTIAENTPVEQEIALDPELLGKVFENLLASYNPETAATARKQTSSFYTPRPIVDFMVDESLKAYLAQALQQKLAGVTAEDAMTGLEILFAYTQREHPFSDDEKDVLLTAINECHILDPACGSGAFPMGILHKLVFILSKLDPHNERWRDRQLAKANEIDDIEARELAVSTIERNFTENSLSSDYSRKLYLIENCIYGVDIQPIAIQISKLRFFISLVCDQKVNRDKSKNYGVLPLPNLETKFVAADTLMSLSKHGQLNVFAKPKVQQLERQLEDVRHRYFTAQTRVQKRSLQQKDHDLRRQLIAELDQLSLADEDASKRVKIWNEIASWNPYDQYAAATFFDAEWMFGRSVAGGFHVVIGNPPYQSAIDHKKLWGEEYWNRIKDRYETARGTWDLYIPFFEVAVNLCLGDGTISFITPNKFLSVKYGTALRTTAPKVSRITRLTDVSHLRVFQSASVYPVITQLQKSPTKEKYDIRLYLPKSRESDQFDGDNFYETVQPSTYLSLLPDNLWGFLLSPNMDVLQLLLTNCQPFSTIADITATTTAAEADEYGTQLSVSAVPGWRILNTGTIDPYRALWADKPLRHKGMDYRQPVIPFTSSIISTNRRRLFSTPKIIVAKMALKFEGFVDESGGYAALNCNAIATPREGWSLFALAALLHSKTVAFIYKQFFDGLRMSGGYLPFQGPHLRTIPIPAATAISKSVLDRLGKLRSSVPLEQDTSQITFVNEVIDACVVEVYFPNYMTARNCQLIPIVAKLLDELNLKASANDNLLVQFYELTTASEHPIRKHLLSLNSKCPELAVILESDYDSFVPSTDEEQIEENVDAVSIGE